MPDADKKTPQTDPKPQIDHEAVRAAIHRFVEQRYLKSARCREIVHEVIAQTEAKAAGKEEGGNAKEEGGNAAEETDHADA